MSARKSTSPDPEPPQGQSGVLPVPSGARAGGTVSPRHRVNRALQHLQPDRAPVDFLAATRIWDQLVRHFGIEAGEPGDTEYFDPAREAVLRELEVDCRVVTYDQFCRPPDSAMHGTARVDWWNSPSRSTPNRMWRRVTSDGEWLDVWGRRFRIAESQAGTREEICACTLGDAASVDELRHHPWPEPEWWDFGALPDVIDSLDKGQEPHLRFRAGSIFEVGWQLRGMEQFLTDMILSPAMPAYIMDRLTEVTVELTRRALAAGGGRIDMVYLYDDVATQNGLMISKEAWRREIRPRHSRIVELAKSLGKRVMYHCDGAVRPLIPELIELGIDVLNPIQVSAGGMDPLHLKGEFGDRLSFHGAIDIDRTLSRGSCQDVKDEVRARVETLGAKGGYILAGTHHIQADTPLRNVLAMYDLELRRGRP